MKLSFLPKEMKRLFSLPFRERCLPLLYDEIDYTYRAIAIDERLRDRAGIRRLRVAYDTGGEGGGSPSLPSGTEGNRVQRDVTAYGRIAPGIVYAHVRGRLPRGAIDDGRGYRVVARHLGTREANHAGTDRRVFRRRGRAGHFLAGRLGRTQRGLVWTGDVPFPRLAPLIGRGNARHRGTNHGEKSEKRCILHSDQSQMGAGNSRLSGRCRLVSPDIDSYKRRQPIRLYGQFHPYRDDSFPFRGPAPTNRGNARASHRDTEWHGRGQARQEGGNRRDGIVGSRP